ncbi:hypothetical protein [Streptococcus equi]|uniref:hypothetical protein n=1 Tax=Streptococcus equi TaxID=1336 RepID=UPI001E3E1B37|nr:hypothetical protein [Streptococcus equi]
MIPKFRVWDKVKQAMSTVEAIDYIYYKIYPFYSKYIRRYIPFGEAVLMQLAHDDDNTIYDKDIIIDCDSGEVGVVFMTMRIVLGKLKQKRQRSGCIIG